MLTVPAKVQMIKGLTRGQVSGIRANAELDTVPLDVTTQPYAPSQRVTSIY